jgi:hypothetical protein
VFAQIAEKVNEKNLQEFNKVLKTKTSAIAQASMNGKFQMGLKML